MALVKQRKEPRLAALSASHYILKEAIQVGFSSCFFFFFFSQIENSRGLLLLLLILRWATESNLRATNSRSVSDTQANRSLLAVSQSPESLFDPPSEP